MEIKLTEQQTIGGYEFVSSLSDPFYRQVVRIRQKALNTAAKKYVTEHRVILTLQTLPEDIYKALPKATFLQLKLGNHTRWGHHGLELPAVGEYPVQKGFIGEKYSYHGAVEAIDVIKCHEKAHEDWNSVNPLLDRGIKLGDLLTAYLDEADFRTVQQIMWSAPQVVDAFWTLNMTGHEKYKQFRSRNHTPKDIFLDRVRKRREDTGDRRRPRSTFRPPSTELQALIGEAKLLHTATKST